MSTIKVDTIATRTGSGNITASNTIAGTSATLSGTLGVTGATSLAGTLGVTGATSLAGTTVSSSTLNMSSSLMQFSGNISLPNVGACLFRPSADTIAFGINNGQRVSVNQHGLLFGTDTAAANALDDYEEGTWTPAFSFTSNNGGHTTANAAGHYLKIGSFAYVQGYIALAAKNSASGDCRIGMGSLPFTPRSTANYTYVGVYINSATGDFQGNNQMFGQLQANDATLRMYASQGGGSVDQLNAVDVQNGTDFRFAGWIPVN